MEGQVDFIIKLPFRALLEKNTPTRVKLSFFRKMTSSPEQGIDKLVYNGADVKILSRLQLCVN